MRPRWEVAALLVALPALASGGWAQLAPSPDAPPVSTAPAPAPEEKPAATIKLNVNLVEVFFTVKDNAGNLVPHLTKDDCTVTEDKQPQTLNSFVAETHQPLTLGILLDTSGSQVRVLPLEQDVGSQFLERVIKPKDEAFLLSFDVDVDLLQDYTNSPRLLARAMSKAEINTAGGNGASGHSRRRRRNRSDHRKAQGNPALRRGLPGRQPEDEPGDGPQGDDPADRRRG